MLMGRIEKLSRAECVRPRGQINDVRIWNWWHGGCRARQNLEGWPEASDAEERLLKE